MSLAERLMKAERPDRVAEVRVRVHDRLVEALGPKLFDADLSEKELQELVHERLHVVAGSSSANGASCWSRTRCR